MKVVKEFKNRLGPPQVCGQILTLEVRTVASCLGDADQDVVKTVVDRYYFRAEERVIASWKEEKWLPDLMEKRLRTRCPDVVLSSFEASYLGGYSNTVTSKPPALVQMLNNASIWLDLPNMCVKLVVTRIIVYK
jgi:hypothetical protein